MRKIILTNFEVEVLNGKETIKAPYDFKSSLLSIMFGEHMKHNSQALMDYSDIKEKIKTATDEVLLEQVEYDKVLRAVESFQGYREIDLEFVRRIKNAPEVEVKEKK